jgi:hypothetical protein
MSDYEKQLEDQNEELRQMLADAQKDFALVKHNLYIVEDVFGVAGHVECSSPVIAHGPTNLELYIRRLKNVKHAISQRVVFLGYCIKVPFKCVFKNRVTLNPANRVYWFSDKMQFIEGFEFNEKSGSWGFYESGNSMEWNVRFTDSVERWFTEGTIK